MNVLRGEMSMVGPRPPMPIEVMGYEDHAYRRLLVKPGITGLWQVSGRNELTWEETVALDLNYVENWSVIGDVLLIMKTVKAVLTPQVAN
jgi:lipopolysaccharide/colanic/teichoic acid biosynthesis glycosyltransferase